MPKEDNIKNLSRYNLDIVLEYHNSPNLLITCILVEEIDFDQPFSLLLDLRDITLTLNPGQGHTTEHHSSITNYVPSFIKIA